MFRFIPNLLKPLSLILLWILSPNTGLQLFAQDYILSNWTVEDGLSSNDVQDLLQDEDGFIWVATEHGLNKFDGYTFDKHRYHPNDSTSIGANFISSICKDDQGNIWTNLSVGIVSKYDKRTRKFKNYIFPDRRTFIFDINFISGLGIYISTNKGLFSVSSHSDQMIERGFKEDNIQRPVYKTLAGPNQHFYLNTEEGLKLSDSSMHSIRPVYFVHQSDTIPFDYQVEKLFEDSKKISWIQTHHGSIYKSEDGIHFTKSLTGTGKAYTNPLKQLFIIEDEKNVNWVFSNNGELQHFDAPSQSWKFSKDQPATAFAFKDKEEHIWICTKAHQLLKWNENKWELIIDLSTHLNFWDINHVLVDEKNGIWLGSRKKGLWRIHNRKWPINNWLNSTETPSASFDITALQIENTDYMWLGTFNNLYRYYFETEALVPLRIGSKNGKSFARNSRINAVHKNIDGKLWVGTSKGLVIIESNEKDYRYITIDTSQQKNVKLGFIRCLHPDQSGRMWIGTTQGLLIYEPQNDQFHYYLPDLEIESSEGIRSQNIRSIFPVNQTTFLIGYVKEGVDLCTYDPTDHSISCQKIAYKSKRQQPYDLMTANVFYRTETEYWLGTYSKGLLKIDLDNLTMKPLSDNFPLIPNVKGIQKGKKGNLWISSIDGIRSVNPNDQTFYRFSKSSGLSSNQFNLNSSAQDHLGNLYFGSLEGLNKIQPSNWYYQDTIATPILTDFKKYDERVIFDQQLNEVESISLTYQDDYITFEFVSPTYHNPADVQYAYQLQDFDMDWRYCKNQLSATYTNLAPGNYSFKVRAGNKGGFLNSEIKQIQITVSPPFWQTSWFILFILGMTGFLIWLAYKIQERVRLNRLQIATEIRKKAADDFHDELGHRLTKIGLFVESLMLQKDQFPPSSAHLLRKIQGNASELYHSTKDFIWAMNPSKDSALELFVLLKDFGEDLFEDTSIQFSVEGIKEEYKDYLLDMDMKRQLILIFKEAMNNALKHSSCTAVMLKIKKHKKQIQITLSDNGKGFLLTSEKFGYGIGSMYNRSKKIGGQLEIKSKIEHGTKILFKL